MTLNPITLNPIQIKAVLIAIAAALAIMLSLTIWALLERSGRLGCKVDLVQARDQVKVLADRLEDQTKAINDLGQATANGRLELRQMVARVTGEHSKTRQTVAQLEKAIQAPTPIGADGRAKDCRDAIREWRESRKAAP